MYVHIKQAFLAWMSVQIFSIDGLTETLSLLHTVFLTKGWIVEISALRVCTTKLFPRWGDGDAARLQGL